MTLLRMLRSVPYASRNGAACDRGCREIGPPPALHAPPAATASPPARQAAWTFATRASTAIVFTALAFAGLTADASASGATYPAGLAPAAIDARLAGAGTLAAFDAALAEIVVALGRAARDETDPSREERLDPIGRFTAFERFQELTAGRARCDVMVTLIGFGYAPREENVDPRTLPDAAQEVIALAPLYCALVDE